MAKDDKPDRPLDAGLLPEHMPLTVQAQRLYIVEMVQRVICEQFHYRLDVLLSARRTADISWARHIGMELSYRLSGLSSSMLAPMWNREDHGTILHARRHVRNRCRHEPQARTEVASVLNAVTKELKTIPTMRRRLPDTRPSITHKFRVGSAKGYVNIGLFPDGSPGEMFLKMDKSEWSGWTNCIGILTSLALQSGVPMDAIVAKLEHQRFEPSGPTGNPDIKIAASIVDYVFRWMKIKFAQK